MITNMHNDHDCYCYKLLVTIIIISVTNIIIILLYIISSGSVIMHFVLSETYLHNIIITRYNYREKRLLCGVQHSVIMADFIMSDP